VCAIEAESQGAGVPLNIEDKAVRAGAELALSQENRPRAHAPCDGRGETLSSRAYTRWDQRGKPVLLSYVKLADGKRLYHVPPTTGSVTPVATQATEMPPDCSLSILSISLPSGQAVSTYFPEQSKPTLRPEITYKI
jgi:hypothetical protein